MKKHKHADIIHAWADGAQIQYKHDLSDGWRDTSTPSWAKHTEYRVKPEKVYPHTSLSETEVDDIYYELGSHEQSLLRVADAAIKQYILDLEKEQSCQTKTTG